MVTNKEFIYVAKEENLSRILSETEAFLNEQKTSTKVIGQINISIEELFINICRYAYKDEEGKVSISFNIDEGVITLIIKDNGVPFNPLEKEDPDITLSIEDRPIGGLGIYMVKKFMDNVEYDYQESTNILKMTKKI